jgi:hypothetical protein
VTVNNQLHVEMKGKTRHGAADRMKEDDDAQHFQLDALVGQPSSFHAGSSAVGVTKVSKDVPVAKTREIRHGATAVFSGHPGRESDPHRPPLPGKNTILSAARDPTPCPTLKQIALSAQICTNKNPCKIYDHHIRNDAAGGNALGITKLIPRDEFTQKQLKEFSIW